MYCVMGYSRCLFFIILWSSAMMSPSLQDSGSVGRLPIIFVYTVVEAVCKYGLPSYIKVSLEQAVASQPDCDVILASNFGQCPKINEEINKLPNVLKLDINSKVSYRTKLFMNLSHDMFQRDYSNELWLTSAYRFFNLEDLMIEQKYSEILHVEADNMLYGRISNLLPIFRTGYPGLAATPLNDKKSFITASVLWIASLNALKRFNDFLLLLAKNMHGERTMYYKWLRQYACCKHGGVDPDENGQGIKPFAVNEMSMLAYYHHVQPHHFFAFPVVPAFNYILNRYTCNMSEFGPGGTQVGPATGPGVWDPNSWGQYLGGTSSRKGRDKGFRDSSHVAGQAIGTSRCRPEMICSNRSSYAVRQAVSASSALLNNTVQARAGGGIAQLIVAGSVKLTNATGGTEVADSFAIRARRSLSALSGGSDSSPQLLPGAAAVSECVTAPFVRCGDSLEWTPLWNLHVHGKNTHLFRSQSCPCSE